MRPHQNILRRVAPLVLLSSFLVAVAPAQKTIAWGDNGVGQLNIPVAAQTGASAIKAGYYFSLVLKNGGLYACGDNSYGELNVPLAAQSGISVFAAGVLHSLAIKDGGVIAWGSNERGETVVPASALSGVTAVAAGEYSSLALKDGGVIGWGNNDYGLMNIPLAVQSGVSTIASGSYHALALKNGGVVGWGFDVAGSLQIPVGAQSNVVKIACGYLHSLALRADGSVVAWGWNNAGQCNVPVAAQSGVVAITAGYDFSWALKDDGSIIGWGDNDYGWLNIPGDTTPVVAISSSAYHTVALKAAAWATLDQAEVYSGYAATGTVHLSTPAGAGGVTVGLSSDNANVHVPASAIVPEGASDVTFPVTTDPMFGANVPVKVQTSYNDTATVAAKLTLKGVPVTVAFSRPSIVGGSTTNINASVTLAFSVASDTTFDLSSTNPAVLSAPATVTVLAGHTSATVPLTHNAVNGPAQSVTITASKSGGSSSGALQVDPFRATLTLESVTITAGETTYAFVTLNTATRNAITATTGGSDSKVTMPSTVKINAGSRTGFFPITTNPSATAYSYPVKVTVNGNESTTYLKVQALPSVASVTVGSSILGNTKVLATVKLNKAAGVGGQVINLSATAGITVPASITVAEGLNSATFDVTAPNVDESTPGQITASGPVNQIVKNVTITPLLLSGMLIGAETVNSGGSFTVMVMLRATPSVDTEVAITSNNPLVTVPATVTVLAGTSQVTFTAHAGTTTRSKTVKITATKSGKLISKTIVVNP